MNLNSETIFSFYTYKDKNIYCQVKVSPKSVKYKKNCRCFTQEDWKIFDNELQKLITATNDWNDEKCLQFNINPIVEVKVQKSKLSLEKICKYLDYDKYEKDKKYTDVESNIILECLIEFLLEVPKKPKREPQNESSLNALLSSPLSYEPYTPSKTKDRFDNVDTVKTPGIDFIGFNEESDSSNETVAVPKCKLIKINRGSCESNGFSQNEIVEIKSSENATLDSSERKRSSKSNSLDEVIIEMKSKIRSSKKASSSSTESDIQTNTDLFNEVIEETDDEIISQEKLKLKDTETNNNSKLIESQEINTHRKKQEIENSRQTKNRNNTVASNLYKIEQQGSKEKHYHCENKNTKQRSMSIHEIPSIIRVSKEKSLRKDSNEFSKINPFKKLEKRDKRHKSEKNKYDSNENIRISKEENTIKEKNIQPAKKSEKSSENDEYVTKKYLEIQPKEGYNESEDIKVLNQNESLQKLNNNSNKLNIPLSFLTEPGAEASLEKVKRERNPKSSSTEVSKSLRRSERSPTKPKRLVEEEENSGSKKRTKKHKSSRRSKELFGTDDDDDFFENTNSNANKDEKIKTSAFVTPVGKKPPKCLSSSSSSSKKKRKREENIECEQEKRGMSKWLSKKKSLPLDQKAPKSSKETVKSSSSKSATKNVKPDKVEKSDAPEPMTIELLSKEELESINTKSRLMQKENAKLRAELDKMCTSPPKEVEILSLQSIPLDDILNSFSKYKSELDEIFKNNRKKDYIKGHDGINHCFVIRLLPNNIQMKMLDKLTEVYSNENNSTQATLFANALFPEWVIRVYMEKFNFTRQQAMNQITAQEEFRLYMEEQSDNSFMFD